MLEANDTHKWRSTCYNSNISQFGINPFDCGGRNVDDSSAFELRNFHFIQHKLPGNVHKMNLPKLVTQNQL